VAKLVVNPTSPSRREIPLSRSTIVTIGRDPSNDLVLPDAMVSRRHAVVEHRGQQFYLRDCNSANGSVVNGDRVTERALRDGDLVAIGSMRLLFREDLAQAGSGKIVPHPSALPLRCASCNAEYRRGDVFCRECGAQVAQPSGPPKAVCPSCGTAVPLPARFCNGCGGTLAPDGARVEEPAEAEEVASRRRTHPIPLAARPQPAPVASGSMAMAPELRAGRRPSSDPSGAPAREPRLAERRPEVAAPAARAQAPAPAGSRFAAAFVDGVFVLSGQLAILAPVAWYWWARETPRTPAEVSYLPVLASFTLLPLALLLGALYHVYFWTVKGATPGKELLDLRVVTEDGRSPLGIGCATLRAFGYLLGFASLGVGFAPIAFGGGALHDRIAGTRVVQGAGK
jgi:uncharacterized RDD family membrane protein YckC